MKLIDSIKRKNILVIGDVMLDVYYMGEVKRISPEAPVPIFKKRYEKKVLGGAANVAANLVAANQKVSIMTIIGDDNDGKTLKQSFSELSINTDFILKGKRRTTVKTRFIASNNQQVMRLDVEENESITLEECSILLSLLKTKIKEYDLIVISDYLKGLMSYDFTQGIINIADKSNIKVIIDVKDPKFEKYSGAFLLKPNLMELGFLTGMPVETESEIIYASNQLKRSCNCKYVLTTRGEKGMTLTGDFGSFTVESVGKEVFDVTGAGDTTLAYFAACLVNGLGVNESVKISNYAAGLQVAMMGTCPVELQKVSDLLENSGRKEKYKLLPRDEAFKFRTNHRTQNIVFTNGCFDILHVGHIRYLKEAAALGDILVVGLNSDDSVRRLKGEKRPINKSEDRAELLCALESVDYVFIFDEDTPYELIQRIQPDILVKGGDYNTDEVVGKDIVESRGGKVVLMQLVEGISTTHIVQQVRGE